VPNSTARALFIPEIAALDVAYATKFDLVALA
jgi:hypothetical protein